nr:hypothetical protein [Massilia sp. UBA6681]
MRISRLFPAALAAVILSHAAHAAEPSASEQQVRKRAAAVEPPRSSRS